MIAITGDLIDSRNTNVEIALRFVQEAMKIAPCYYVTGNHEARKSAYDELKIGMVSIGVLILEDERNEININGDAITLIGVNDPSFQTDYLFGDSEVIINDKLTELHTVVSRGIGNSILPLRINNRPEVVLIELTSNLHYR